MYRLYCEYCQENNITPRNESLYRQIFVEEFNLCFKKPYNDTCTTCDKFSLLLKSVTDENERAQLESEKLQHQHLAEFAYEEKKKDRLACKLNPNLVVFSFGLQKCLPTPYLKSSISFYKRKLWTLNLTIFETQGTTNSAKCYLWNETIAQRGGQEIASCLYTYLNSIPSHINKIIMYSDCCPGQNRNILLSVMLLTVIEHSKHQGRKIDIYHKFLVPGHTHMEADTIHAAIEKTKNSTTARIDIPRDWANLIRLIPRKPPIFVQEMKQEEFLCFKSLLSGKFQHAKTNTQGQPVVWSKIRLIYYSSENLGVMKYKNSFTDDEPYKTLSLLRTRTRNSGTTRLLPISDKPLGIPANKTQHLKDMLPYVEESSRPYYLQFLITLTTSQSATDNFIADEEYDQDDEM
ncbi:uncharacterized protein [Diabrotica undecimpunctata]|uniref:uncharacterized protein n=1 Tax=Diabrotica undecimpunctata TaxID=50387 RepID=UPI003B639CA6